MHSAFCIHLTLLVDIIDHLLSTLNVYLYIVLWDYNLFYLMRTKIYWYNVFLFFVILKQYFILSQSMKKYIFLYCMHQTVIIIKTLHVFDI